MRLEIFCSRPLRMGGVLLLPILYCSTKKRLLRSHLYYLGLGGLGAPQVSRMEPVTYRGCGNPHERHELAITGTLGKREASGKNWSWRLGFALETSSRKSEITRARMKRVPDADKKHQPVLETHSPGKNRRGASPVNTSGLRYP